MRLATTLLVISLYSVQAVAQINESDTSSFQLNAALRGFYQSGNVEMLRVTSQLDVSKRLFSKLVFKTQNNLLYQDIFLNKADQDILSRNYLYYQPQKKVYPYLIGYVSTNFRRKIELRSFAGAGVTWQLLRKPNSNIKLSTNLIYEQTSFNTITYNDNTFDGSADINTARNTIYISGFHQLKQQAVQLNYELYWQQSLDNAVNYRYHIAAGADLKVIKGLFVQSRLIYAYENIIAKTVNQKDVLLTWGVAYKIK